jgi:hypothetical protein
MAGLLKLKNKAEREAFVKGYPEWKSGVWKDIPELDIRFYRCDFANGAALIVTKYREYIAWKDEYATGQKYHLILPKDDPYIDRTHMSGDI